MKQFDTIVVGGGIIGLSCGYYLTKEKKRVLVLDAWEFGSGSSGACDDMILLQSKKPGLILELAMESLEMYRSLHRELSMDLGFDQLGGMILIENDRDLAIMEEFVSSQRDCGLNVTIVGRDELRRRQPYVNKRFLASTYSADDAQVDPLLVMRGFIHAGRNLGMEINYKNAVTAAEPFGAGGWRVETRSGEVFTAGEVVIAAGAWSKQVGNLFGVEIPIEPKRGQLLITEKIPPVGETNLWTAEYMVTKLRPDLVQDRTDEPNRIDLGLGFSFTRTTDGNYLIGSTREQAGLNKGVRIEAARELTLQVVDILPIMKHVHIIRHIAGFRPAVSDGTVILGKDPRQEGLYIAAGHEGDGIAMAPVTGKLLSDIVTGKPGTERLEPLSPRRFADSCDGEQRYEA